MILAVPMVVITRIVCDHLEHPYAKTLMRLLEGNVFEVCLLFMSAVYRCARRGVGGGDSCRLLSYTITQCYK